MIDLFDGHPLEPDIRIGAAYPRRKQRKESLHAAIAFSLFFPPHRTPKNRNAPSVIQMMPPQKMTLARANAKKNAANLRNALTTN